MRLRDSTIEYLKKLIDHIHLEYFQRTVKSINSKEIIKPESIDFGDYIVLIRKGIPFSPELFVGGQEKS